MNLDCSRGVKVIVNNFNSRKLSYSIVLLLVALLVLSANTVFAAVPYGANTQVINVSTALADLAGSDNAYSGNVTEINLYGFSTTQAWQGYYGNVTGTIQLADASDNIMYNWTTANPKGQVYASTNSTINWIYIQCFNFTAAGTYAVDTANAGGVSQFGTNLTQLEAQFNINYTDVDRINETFVFNGVGGHQPFYTANNHFAEGECMSTRVYDAEGTGTITNFEEPLLYEPTTASVIFASILEQSTNGFDQRPHDFEMLVLEDGHGTDVAATTYYFFVELQ
jgi:hypothetical protein